MDYQGNGHRNGNKNKNGKGKSPLPAKLIERRRFPLASRGNRPSYPFYGLYANRRPPPWFFSKPPQKTGPTKYIIIGLLAAVIFLSFATVALIVGAFGAGAGVAVAGYSYYAKGLSLDREYALTFETTRIFDRNGILLYEKLPDAGARDFVPLKDIPKTLIDATIAAEDPTFFENQGVDFYAIARAVYINLSRQGSSGASTITQQVARLLYLPPEERYQQTPERKIREMILATMLTDKFSKEQILEKYLNQIYYGNLAYGIEAASQGYFGKHAKELTLAEASMLAGLPQTPSLLDPTVNYDGARARQRYVLDQMVKTGKISEAEAQEAFQFDIKSHLQDRRKRTTNIRAPHFVNYIIQELSNDNGLRQLRDAGVLINQDDWEQGGFDIYTTIDVRLVDEGERVARQRIEELKKQKASNAALVAIRPNTGEILSMVGSVDFNSKEIDGQYNAAIAQRQPGSSIKPITYAAAMTKGWTAATVIPDVKTTFPGGGGKGYTPLNFDGRFNGPVAVRNALGSSLNIAAVKTLQFDGIQYMMNLARDMGINFQNTADFYGLPLTLGGGEVRLLDLTSAYTVFADLGVKVDPVSILKVNRRGKVLYEFDPANIKGRQILSPQISYIMTNILSDNDARLLAFARSNPLVLNRPAAAKTGTTNDFKDSWTVGYTPDLAVGVWIGNNDNTQMLAVAGSIGGGFVWNEFMSKVYSDPELSKAIQQSGKPLQRDFTKPDGLVQVEICVESGLLLPDKNKPEYTCPQKRTELFPANNVPKERSTLHQKVKIPKRIGPDGKPVEIPSPAPGADVRSDLTINDPYYCVAGETYPPELVEEKIFYNYPAELKEWGISKGKLPPPTQQCPPYVAPTPTPAPEPTIDLLNPSGTLTSPESGTPTLLTPIPTVTGPTPTPATPISTPTPAATLKTPAPPATASPTPTPRR